MDTSLSACAGFFRHAVGARERRTTLPAGYAKYGVDQGVEERTFAVLKGILEGAATDGSAPKGSEQQEGGDVFAAGMDETRIEGVGARPLKPFLVRIAAVPDRNALAAEITLLQVIGTGAAFRLEVGPDDRNSASNILPALPAQPRLAGSGRLAETGHAIQDAPPSVRGARGADVSPAG